MEKKCRKCKESKGVGEFYKDSRAKDGLYSYCKPCHATVRVSKWDGKRAYMREYVRTYVQRPEQRLRDSARQRLRSAVRSGKVLRQPCEKCGEAKVHAHHHKGYEGDNWRVVQWLCRPHHHEIHRRWLPSSLSNQQLEKTP